MRILLAPQAWHENGTALRSETRALHLLPTLTGRFSMRHTSGRHRLSSFTLLLVNGRARRGTRAGFRITHAWGRVLILLVILLAAHVGSAHAAGPFIPIDLGTLGGSSTFPIAV